MPSKLTYWLIGSAVLNAALLGIVAGRMVNSAKPQPVVDQTTSEFVKPRGVSAAVQAAWDKLPEADRKELYKQFVNLRNATEDEDQRIRDAAQRVSALARSEPFDEAELRSSVVVYRHYQSLLQNGVDDVLISHLRKMPPEAREVAARGLLTPYTQWMRPRTETDSSASVQPSPTPSRTPGG